MWHTLPALALAPGLLVIPHFDEIPKAMLAIVNHSYKNVTTVGVEGSTALVGREGRWMVYGKGGVTVFEGRKKVRYTEGKEVRLLLPPLA
jgi:cyanophycinase-like exopeptidase